MSTPHRPPVLALLAESYARLRAAWKATIEDQDCAVQAPHAEWRAVDADGEGTAWHVLLQAGELAGTFAGNAIRAHLALLCRAYWPDLLNTADDPIPHPAVYPPARAVLEATTLIGWTLDPTLTPDARALRAAQLLLWSQVSTRKHDAEWQHTVAEAGLTVKASRKRPDEYYVQTGEGSQPLSMGRMVRTVHGDVGSDLYSEWSAANHADPLSLAKRTRMRDSESGLHVGGLFREDHDVEVAVHVADLITTAIMCQAGYFGRRTAPAQECRAVAGELREVLPIVIEEVRIRNSGG